MDTYEYNAPLDSDFINRLAVDEVDEALAANSAEEWDDLMGRIAKRRFDLDEFSRHRYERLLGDHAAIQAMFDSLNRSLGEPGSGLPVFDF